MTTRKQDSTSTGMTHEKAVALARELVPAIAERAPAGEAQRCLPEQTIQELVHAGLIRLLTPARWGGHELSINALVDSALEIAKADASTAWCYSIFLIHNWILAQYSEQTQREVWANNPDALISSSFAPVGSVTRTTGGYILNGSWPWSSGVDYSDWCMLGGILSASAAPPDVALFLVPRSDYEIRDTWFVAGLKASGSKNVEAADVFVPEHRVTRFSDIGNARGPGSTINTGSLYKLPFLLTNAASLVAPVLGATIDAYEIWRDASSRKLTVFTREPVASLPHVRIRLAETEATIQIARLLLQECLDMINPDHPVSLEQRSRSTRNIAYIAKLCVGTIEQIFLASGGSANYETNPLQRHWRDVHAMVVHPGLNFDAAGDNFGRLELGLSLDKRHAFF